LAIKLTRREELFFFKDLASLRAALHAASAPAESPRLTSASAGQTPTVKIMWLDTSPTTVDQFRNMVCHKFFKILEIVELVTPCVFRLFFAVLARKVNIIFLAKADSANNEL